MKTHKLRIKILESAAITKDIDGGRLGLCRMLAIAAVTFALLFLMLLCAFRNFKTQNNHKSFVYTTANLNENRSCRHDNMEEHGKTDNTTRRNNEISMQKIRYDAVNKVVTSSMKRTKRFVIFNDGGVVKLVIGVSYPIIMPDRQRSLACFYNLQMQYMPPPRPLFFWSLYNTTTFPVANKRRRQTRGETAQQQARDFRDLSREYIYKAIEALYARAGLPGEACLLQAICELAQLPFHEGNIFHDLLNAIFTPTLHNVSEKYLDAHLAGRYGAACTHNYRCPMETNWLRRNSLFG